MDSQISRSTSKTSEGQKVPRKRLQLSCGECRKKKLSCDRKLPCQRCVRSGRSGQCSFETGQPSVAMYEQAMHIRTQQQAQKNSEEIQKLRSEVAHLTELVSKIHSQNEATIVAESVAAIGVSEMSYGLPSDEFCGEAHGSIIAIDNNLIHPKERAPPSYYTQHHLFRFFEEIPELFPFMKETCEELLEPHGVRIRRDKPTRNDLQARIHCEAECRMEDILPPKDVVDSLVLSYLNNFEQLHRIVHIPTFNKEYAEFWLSGSTRHSTMTALILSMISISVCIPASYNSLTANNHQTVPDQWISACDKWLRGQSSNGRELVHYQIACLMYLAKRMHMVRKKGWCKDTSSLLQNAIMDGLHRDSTSSDDTIFTREMKRRIWAVIRELDLQNSFEAGIPTLLNTIDAKSATPGNIDDEEFDETSKILPISNLSDKHTRTSYQIHSSYSWELRLEVSRRLFATGSPKVLSYDEVLQLTHQLTQAIHSLPAWDEVNSGTTRHTCSPILTHAFLNFQLSECIIGIHRPYLKRKNCKFWLSENICYQISRDILLLNLKLMSTGFQCVTLLREDLLLASLTLTRVTMLQPKGSSSIIMSDSAAIIDFLKQCLPTMGNGYLYGFHKEPWCFLTMATAIKLLEIHAGEGCLVTGKLDVSQRILELYHKHIENQGHRSNFIRQNSISRMSAEYINTHGQSAVHGAVEFPASSWLPFSAFESDPFDLGMDLGSMWEF
ncbi:transcriptional regulatory protein C139.03-like protein 6 [Botrytis cinerea]